MILEPLLSASLMTNFITDARGADGGRLSSNGVENKLDGLELLADLYCK